jgi:hypothetical protein
MLSVALAIPYNVEAFRLPITADQTLHRAALAYHLLLNCSSSVQ